MAKRGRPRIYHDTDLCRQCHRRPATSKNLCQTCYLRAWRNDHPDYIAPKRRVGKGGN